MTVIIIKQKYLIKNTQLSRYFTRSKYKKRILNKIINKTYADPQEAQRMFNCLLAVQKFLKYYSATQVACC